MQAGGKAGEKAGNAPRARNDEVNDEEEEVDDGEHKVFGLALALNVFSAAAVAAAVVFRQFAAVFAAEEDERGRREMWRGWP